MDRMKLTTLTIFAPLVLGACTTARPMMAPSGAQGLKVWCEVPSQCYERAARECPYGYTIEAKEQDQWGLGDTDGNLFIVCKVPRQQTQAATGSPATLPNGSTPPPTGDNCKACERIGNP